MQAYAIVIKDHDVSENAFEKMVNSSKNVGNEFEIKRFDAIIPSKAKYILENTTLRWTYPWDNPRTDITSGLKLTPYSTRDRWARIACALSHLDLWKNVAMSGESTLILEHDAYFINRFDFDPDKTNASVIGINNPLGATRKSKLFHNIIQNNSSELQDVPIIDSMDIPQGLAGNSAYILKKCGAIQLQNAVKEHGLWPNDAIMCQQLISNMKVTKKYYTKVQRIRSTTTL